MTEIKDCTVYATPGKPWLIADAPVSVKNVAIRFDHCKLEDVQIQADTTS